MKLTTILLSLAVLVTGCSDDPVVPAEDAGVDYSSTLSGYSQNVVVSTYADMKAKADALHSAATSYAASPTDQGLLDAACDAWRASREPWEASEAFLFGPAEYLGLDPLLDSWPVDQQQLDDVLASAFSLTPEFIADGLGPALRGFHTIEYLLFRDGAPRAQASVTAREREYLTAATAVLAGDATALHDAWAGGYATEFANASRQGSRYLTQLDAISEMVEAMIGICDEVANGKIADPFDQQDTQLVESQFSWNSLDDFQDNIRSVRNAYTGGYHNGTDGPGLDTIVAELDAALDARLKSEIDTAIAAIAAIPQPFRNNLNRATEITAAQQAIDRVRLTLEDDVKDLLELQ